MHPDLLASFVITLACSLIATFWPLNTGLMRCGALCIGASWFLTLVFIVANRFTGRGIDESVLFQLSIGLQGLDTRIYLLVALSSIGGGTLILSWVVWILKRSLHSYRLPRSSPRQLASSALVVAGSLFSLAVHPAVRDGRSLTTYLWDSYTQDSGLILAHFRTETPRPDNNLKNFVYIYAESLERTYLDKRRFESLMTEIPQLEKKAISFRGIGQAPLTQWTIAGMTASQCGVPMALFDVNKIESYPSAGKSHTGIRCIGDILSQNGYHLAYIGGADLAFARKSSFYQDQQFNELFGRKEIAARSPAGLPMSAWGIYDDRTLEFAFEKFESLAQQSRPFGLVILTLDTHPPLGHSTPACQEIWRREGSSQMLKAAKCADRLLGRFVRSFLESPHAKNTVLMLGSDHLVMQNDAGLESDDPGRENLLMAFNSGQPPREVQRVATTLDIAPTLLSLLGFEAPAFALGRNLLGPEPTIPELIGQERFYEQLRGWRTNPWKHWQRTAQAY